VPLAIRHEVLVSLQLLYPDWPAPSFVRAFASTRVGGVSTAPYASLNLGDHVGDEPAAVAANRCLLRPYFPAEPLWLRQVHGVAVADAGLAHDGPPEADAAVARHAGQVCAVLTADCLPVLFCDAAGRVVAASHAGWRGLLNGVLERTVDAMGVPPGQVLAWLGPAIGPAAFEVGGEVRDAFVAEDPLAATAFQPGTAPGKWWGDLPALARQRLGRKGVTGIHGGEMCTYCDKERFFSYRRDGVTGRLGSFIWLAGSSLGR
jgi:YfiH family protein